MVTLDEGPSIAGFFFEDQVLPPGADLIGKNMTRQESLIAAQRALDLLKGFDDLAAELVEPSMRALADELGLKAGQLFGILRIAVTGQRVSPPLFETMAIVGKENVISRLSEAVRFLQLAE